MSDTTLDVASPGWWITYSLNDHRFYKRDTRTKRFDLSKPLADREVIQFLTAMDLCDYQAAKALVKENRFKSFEDTNIFPGAPEFYKSREGYQILNTWVPHDRKPKDVPWPNIKKLLERMVNVDEEGQDGYEFLLDFLAHRLRNPHTPAMLLLVFISAPGLGKNTLHKILARIWGEEHSKVLQSNELGSHFNSDQFTNKLLITADEVIQLDDSRSQLLELMKQYATGDELKTEAKYQHAKVIKNQVTWLIMTNQRHAIKLQPNDRRFVVYTNMSPNDGPDGWSNWVGSTFWRRDNLKELTPEAEEEVLGFWYHLTLRDLSNFKLVPPENKARENLKHLSEDTLQQFLKEYRELGLDGLMDSYSYGVSGGIISTLYDAVKQVMGCSLCFKLYCAMCKEIGSPKKKKALFEQELLAAGVEKRDYVFGSSNKPRRVYDFSRLTSL